MSMQSNPSLKKSIALGALLLLAATASGCGVGLPTQPDIDSGAVAVHERSAGAASVRESDSIELGETLQPGGGSGPDVPEVEIVVQSPSRYDNYKGAGKAIGHQKNKWSTR